MSDARETWGQFFHRHATHTRMAECQCPMAAPAVEDPVTAADSAIEEWIIVSSVSPPTMKPMATYLEAQQTASQSPPLHLATASTSINSGHFDIIRKKSLDSNASTMKGALIFENVASSMTLLCAAKPGSMDRHRAKLLGKRLKTVRAFAVDPAAVDASLAGYEDAFDQPVVLCGDAQSLLKVIDALHPHISAGDLPLLAVVVFGTETKDVQRTGVPVVLSVKPDALDNDESAFIQPVLTRLRDELSRAQDAAEAEFKNFNVSQQAGMTQQVPWLAQWASAVKEASSEIPAVVDDSRSLNLEEFRRCAMQLHCALRQKGCVGGRVAVYLEKSVASAWVAAGSLFSSTTFIDIAPWHKGADLKRILDTARPGLIVTTTELAADIPGETPGHVLTISEVEQLVVTESPQAEPGQRSFSVLTSGSTGVSKVILLPDAALTDSSPIFKEVLRPGDRVGSFWLYYYFCCVIFQHCTVVGLPDSAFADAHVLCEHVKKHGITVLFLTPTFLDVLLKNAGKEELASSFATLHTIMLTGERVRDELRAMSKEVLPNARILNIYSINETGDLALEDPSAVNKFKIREGVHVAIQDRSGNAVLRGAVGQLLVRTRCLCKAYLTEDGSGLVQEEELFPTGDLVRWLGDGWISFVRRDRDSHAKIRGFKVNPKVIEGILIQHPHIKSAMCLVTGTHDQDAQLEAAVQLSGEVSTVSERDLREWLLERVPRYMVPSVFRVSEDPLSGQKATSTGKHRLMKQRTRAELFDSLPTLGSAGAVGDQAQLSADEILVADAWRQTLGLPLQGLQPDDHFFDFGGSLLLLRLRKVLEELNGRAPAVNVLIEDSTLAGMGKALRLGEKPAHDFDPEVEAAKFPLDGAAPPGSSSGALMISVQKLKEHKAVFMTGATGLLGAYVMRSLCRRSEVDTVFCLVRAADRHSARTRLLQQCQKHGMFEESWFCKVVVMCGDFAAPNLGIADDDRKRIVDESGLVLHIGAEVNWVKPYASLATANVGGTKEALELAAEAGASLLFASSITASAARGQFNTGYRQTKEVSEVLCSQANEQLSVPSAICRFGDIGTSEEALRMRSSLALPENDFMVILIRSCFAIGLYPDAPWAVSIMAVDQLADWTAQISVSMPAAVFTSVPNDIKAKLVSWSQVWACMGSLLAARKCSLEEWKQAIEQGAADGVEVILRLALILPMVEGYLRYEGDRLANGQGSDEELPCVGAAWAQALACAIKEQDGPASKGCCCAVS